MEYPEHLGRLVLSGISSKFGELRGVHTDRPYQWGVREQFELFAGHTRGAELADKGQFSKVMEAIGYLAPRTTVIRPGDDPEAAIKRVNALTPTDDKRFLKPLCGTRAKGTMLAETTGQAVTFAAREGRPYLVQTVERASFELRHALHRDPQQVKDSSPHGWRLALRKVRSSVEGDGVTPLQQLIETSPDIPWYARVKHRLHRGQDMLRIPAAGERVELAAAGNIDACLPSEQEQIILDTFMLRLAADLEIYVGASLPTICFDIGVKHPDALRQPYDHERLRKQLVLYEYQVPLDLSVTYLP